MNRRIQLSIRNPAERLRPVYSLCTHTFTIDKQKPYIQHPYPNVITSNISSPVAISVSNLNTQKKLPVNVCDVSAINSMILDTSSVTITLLTCRILQDSKPTNDLWQIFGILAQIDRLGLLRHLDECIWRAVLICCASIGGDRMRQLISILYDVLTEFYPFPEPITYGIYFQAMSKSSIVLSKSKGNESLSKTIERKGKQKKIILNDVIEVNCESNSYTDDKVLPTNSEESNVNKSIVLSNSLSPDNVYIADNTNKDNFIELMQLHEEDQLDEFNLLEEAGLSWLSDKRIAVAIALQSQQDINHHTASMTAHTSEIPNNNASVSPKLMSTRSFTGRISFGNIIKSPIIENKDVLSSNSILAGKSFSIPISSATVLSLNNILPMNKFGGEGILTFHISSKPSVKYLTGIPRHVTELFISRFNHRNLKQSCQDFKCSGLEIEDENFIKNAIIEVHNYEGLTAKNLSRIEGIDENFMHQLFKITLALIRKRTQLSISTPDDGGELLRNSSRQSSESTNTTSTNSASISSINSPLNQAGLDLKSSISTMFGESSRRLSDNTSALSSNAVSLLGVAASNVVHAVTSVSQTSTALSGLGSDMSDVSLTGTVKSSSTPSRDSIGSSAKEATSSQSSWVKWFTASPIRTGKSNIESEPPAGSQLNDLTENELTPQSRIVLPPLIESNSFSDDEIDEDEDMDDSSSSGRLSKRSTGRSRASSRSSNITITNVTAQISSSQIMMTDSQLSVNLPIESTSTTINDERRLDTDNVGSNPDVDNMKEDLTRAIRGMNLMSDIDDSQKILDSVKVSNIIDDELKGLPSSTLQIAEAPSDQVYVRETLNPTLSEQSLNPSVPDARDVLIDNTAANGSINSISSESLANSTEHVESSFVTLHNYTSTLLQQDIITKTRGLGLHSQTPCPVCGLCMLDEEIAAAWCNKTSTDVNIDSRASYSPNRNSFSKTANYIRGRSRSRTKSISTDVLSHENTVESVMGDMRQLHHVQCLWCRAEFVPKLHINYYQNEIGPITDTRMDSSGNMIYPMTNLLWTREVDYYSPAVLRFMLEETLARIGEHAVNAYILYNFYPHVLFNLLWHSARMRLPTGFLAQHTALARIGGIPGQRIRMSQLCRDIFAGEFGNFSDSNKEVHENDISNDFFLDSLGAIVIGWRQHIVRAKIGIILNKPFEIPSDLYSINTDTNRKVGNNIETRLKKSKSSTDSLQGSVHNLWSDLRIENLIPGISLKQRSVIFRIAETLDYSLSGMREAILLTVSLLNDEISVNLDYNVNESINNDSNSESINFNKEELHSNSNSDECNPKDLLRSICMGSGSAGRSVYLLLFDIALVLGKNKYFEYFQSDIYAAIHKV